MSDCEPIRADFLNTGFVTGMFCFNNVSGGTEPSALISAVSDQTTNISSSIGCMGGEGSGRLSPHLPHSTGSSPHFFEDAFHDTLMLNSTRRRRIRGCERLSPKRCDGY